MVWLCMFRVTQLPCTDWEDTSPAGTHHSHTPEETDRKTGETGSRLCTLRIYCPFHTWTQKDRWDKQTGESDRQVYLKDVLSLVLLDTDAQVSRTDRCTLRMYCPWYSWTQRRSCWGDRCIDRLFFLMDSAISCSGKLSWLTCKQTHIQNTWRFCSF